MKPPADRRQVEADEPEGLWERLAAMVGGLAVDVAEDRGRAPQLLEELLTQPPVLRECLAVTLERFRSPALAQLLVERSLRSRGAGAGLADLALAILGTMDDSGSAGCVIEEAKARAWGALADARRLQGDFDGAERALHRAAFHLAGSPDPLAEAAFYQLRSRLYRDRGRLDRAIAIQTRAVETFAPLAHPGLVAEACLELATLHLRAMDRQRTLETLDFAMSVLGADYGDACRGELWG